MTLPPHRIAALVLVLLLVGAGWWWREEGPPVVAAVAPRDGVAANPHGAPSSQTDPSEKIAAMAVIRMEEAMKQCESDMAVLRRQRWEAIGATQDLDARLTHALMAGTLGEDAPSPSTPALLEALAAAAPHDAEVAWYRASHCPTDPGCDRDRAIGHLLALEPDNLDGWVMAINEALRRKQGDASLQALLERGAQATYYDPREGEAFLRLQEATQDLPLPKSCATQAVAQGWALVAKSKGGPTSADMASLWAMAANHAQVKAYVGIRNLCAPRDMAPVPERVAACKAVMAKLAGGTGVVDQMVALDVMVELSAGTPEGAEWRERYRNLRWLLANQYTDIRFDNAEVVRRMTQGEVPTVQQALQARGRWPAPADWLPADERARSLILTGRRPPDSRR